MLRFTKTHRCPICGGGKGCRPKCWGFLSDDASYARCTREEFAGTLQREDKSEAYRHYLGESGCDCGTVHDGTDAAARARDHVERPREDENAERTIKRIWDGGDPADTKRIARYFRHRGLKGEVPAYCLKFHPALGYFDDEGNHVGNFPAMIGVFNRLDGERVALQRTYLAADGDGKADVPSPKKTTATVREHALHGAAVRLTHIDSIKDRLALTEGIETGIAVLESTGVPTWATGCAGGLEHAIIPDRVGIVEIWGDNDAGGTGQKAAIALANRLVAEGRTVYVLIPPDADSDWLDVLVKGGGPWALKMPRMEATAFVPATEPTSDNGDEPPRRHPRFLNDLESLAQPDTEYLLGRVVPMRTIVLLVGASGSCKTFTLVDAAFAIATGMQWLGRPVKQGPVVYVEAEGDAAFKYRLLAWKREHGLEHEVCGVEFLYEPIDLMDTKSVDAFIQDVRLLPQPPVAVMIDTMSCCLGDGDENSANDMRVAVNSMKRIRQAFGCTVVATHHTGHANPDRPRGSSKNIDGPDVIILQTKEGNDVRPVLRLHCKKRRSTTPFDDVLATLETRIVAGETTAVLKPTDESAAKPGDRLTPQMLEVLAVLVKLKLDDGVRYSEWRTVCGLSKGSMGRTVAALRATGHVDRIGTGQSARYFLAGKRSHFGNATSGNQTVASDNATTEGSGAKKPGNTRAKRSHATKMRPQRTGPQNGRIHFSPPRGGRMRPWTANETQTINPNDDPMNPEVVDGAPMNTQASARENDEEI